MNSCEWRGCDIGEAYSGSCFDVDVSLCAAAAISLYAVLISVSIDIKLSSSEIESSCWSGHHLLWDMSPICPLHSLLQKGHLVISDVVTRLRTVDTTNGAIVTGRDSASASSAERSRLNKSSIILCYCAGSVPSLLVTALVEASDGG